MNTWKIEKLNTVVQCNWKIEYWKLKNWKLESSNIGPSPLWHLRHPSPFSQSRACPSGEPVYTFWGEFLRKRKKKEKEKRNEISNNSWQPVFSHGEKKRKKKEKNKIFKKMLSKGGGRGHNQAMDFDRRAPNSPNLFPRHGGPKRAGATAALEGENHIEKRQSTGKIVSPGARSCFLFFNFSMFQFSIFCQFFNFSFFSIFSIFQFFNFS